METAVASTTSRDSNAESGPRNHGLTLALHKLYQDERAPEYKGELSRLLCEVSQPKQDAVQIPEYIFERESLKQEVNELLESAGSENWDGEGALAITPGLVGIAHEVIEKLPIYAAKPDVEATPHGEIDFDWVVDQNTMLTVSVAPPNVVAFAGTFPEARLAGKEEWAGELPHFVECCLKRIKQIGKL